MTEVRQVSLKGLQAAKVADVAAALPDPASLPPGTRVVVPQGGPQGWRRLLGGGHGVPTAVRCGALLVRGYVNIGAGTAEGEGPQAAWGTAPKAES